MGGMEAVGPQDQKNGLLLCRILRTVQRLYHRHDMVSARKAEYNQFLCHTWCFDRLDGAWNPLLGCVCKSHARIGLPN